MKNTHPPIVNFPRLHEELTAGPLPENIVFLASVLSTQPQTTSHTVFIEAIRKQFPIPLQEAQKNARLLQEYGTDLWESKQLSTLAAMSQSQATAERKHASELEEIKKFVASQGKSHPPLDSTTSSAASLNNVLISKELTLCIAYDLEQAVIEARRAIEKLGKANASFLSSLHDVDESGETYETITTLESYTHTTDISLSYQSVLEALLPFIPEEALLFTNDADVLASFQDSGLFDIFPSTPFPEPEPFANIKQLQQLSLPAWKMLGLHEANPQLPWTSRTLTLCYPAHPPQPSS